MLKRPPADVKPVLKYAGAKWRIADWISGFFPPHEIYLEPFFGSGAVFFRKAPARLETINDIDGNVVNLFRVLREQPEQLAALIELTPWARDEYYSSYEKTGRAGKRSKTAFRLVFGAEKGRIYRRAGVRAYQGITEKAAPHDGAAYPLYIIYKKGRVQNDGV